MVADHGISCIDLRAYGEGVLVATGHQDGMVSVSRIDVANQAEEPVVLWGRQLHDGPVTSVLLNADYQVITGSTDRTVCVTPLDDAQPRADHLPVQRLHLTLRCQNVRFEGVRTEQEQAKLRQYSAS
jgi:WD40 repeat protein